MYVTLCLQFSPKMTEAESKERAYCIGIMCFPVYPLSLATGADRNVRAILTMYFFLVDLPSPSLYPFFKRKRLCFRVTQPTESTEFFHFLVLHQVSFWLT